MELKPVWLPSCCISSPPGAAAGVGEKPIPAKSFQSKDTKQNVKQGSHLVPALLLLQPHYIIILSKGKLLHDYPASTKKEFWRDLQHSSYTTKIDTQHAKYLSERRKGKQNKAKQKEKKKKRRGEEFLFSSSPVYSLAWNK